jgi:hypothetical protein
MRTALSWSGGKDSALTLWTLRGEGIEPEALITTVTDEYDRISMHGVRFGDLFLEDVRAYRETRLAAAGKPARARRSLQEAGAEPGHAQKRQGVQAG